VIEVSRRVEAGPEDVWRVLSDGWSYPSWVVGASRVRAVDPRWPQQGAQLHHSAGAWPVLLSDSTSVVESEPNHRLVLQARGWPVGEARVDIRIEPVDGGCEVTIFEDATRGVAKLLPAPVRQLLMGGRNTETLQRLAFLAERNPLPVDDDGSGVDGDGSHLRHR
jgi:uncharacterized protein YndB with AHSA1/START domain